MAFHRYSTKVKATILQAATGARGQGKTWADAYAAAKDAGYKGSVQGIVKLLRASKKKIGKPATTAMAATKPSKPTKAVAANGYDPVHKMIDQIVRQKLRAVVEKAIAELRKAVE